VKEEGGGLNTPAYFSTKYGTTESTSGKKKGKGHAGAVPEANTEAGEWRRTINRGINDGRVFIFPASTKKINISLNSHTSLFFQVIIFKNYSRHPLQNIFTGRFVAFTLTYFNKSTLN
jgi:hypothetical protein